MIFKIYNIEKISKTHILMHGKIEDKCKSERKIDLIQKNIIDSDNKDIINNKLSKVNKSSNRCMQTISVRNIISDKYFGFEKGKEKELLEDIYKYTDDIINVKLVQRENIFYNTIDRYLELYKISFSKLVSFDNFESNFCNFISTEFESGYEQIIIEKGLGGISRIEIPISEEGQIVTELTYENIKYLDTCELGPLKIAAMSFECCNNIITKVAYYNSDKLYYGCVEDNLKKQVNKTINNTNQNNEKLVISYDTNYTILKSTVEIVDYINNLIDKDEPDVVVFHNFHLRNKLRLNRQIVCDTYQFACGNLQGRDFSVSELIKTYGIKVENTLEGNAIGLSELILKMRAINLAKELSEISGCPLNKCLENNRAERVEYMLLKELYERKYIFPPILKRTTETYVGGLVLEPMIGFYENFVVLVDFNSLYPSIIQEYDVCFSTVGLCNCKNGIKCIYCEDNKLNSNGDINESDTNDLSNKINLKNKINTNDLNKEINSKYLNNNLHKIKKIKGINEESLKNRGTILPKILNKLVERRISVKYLMKSVKTVQEREILDLRQKALKLTANSIYGCLGFPQSRFCNYAMAAYITRKGRELLHETSITACNLGLQVLYGDTDSLMIYTKEYGNDSCYMTALSTVQKFCNEINNQYNHIEIEIERAFKKLVLYKKKRYAALVYNKNGNKFEFKGLDFIKRNYCRASSELCKNVLELILNRKDNIINDKFKEINNLNTFNNDEIIAEEVYTLCNEFKNKLNNLPREWFIIYKRLSKNPILYNSSISKSLHVELAIRLNKEKGFDLRSGDTVSYIITSNSEGIYACHSDELNEINYNYYLNNQIIPPLLRIISEFPFIITTRIQDVFGIIHEKHSVLLSASSTVFKFVTECCNYTQAYNIICGNCKQQIPSAFYLNSFQKMFERECQIFYHPSTECTECKLVYKNHLNTCFDCSNRLKPHSAAIVFDKFLNQVIKFTNVYEVTDEIKKLVHLYSKLSSYRKIDLKKYFLDEINRAMELEENKTVIN